VETPVRVTSNEAARRWEAVVDDELAGYAEYRLVPGRVIFTHTVVEPQFEGRGIATQLARVAVDDALARGLRITPYCPFIRAYLQRHPEFSASVDYPKTR
jgi:predicted GNAT family acetyltransferase